MAARFRADQVGSYLRPPELLRARERVAKGELTDAGLRAEEDRAIEGVFALQREVGMPVFTDGELRRGSWLTSMAEAVEGFVPERMRYTWHGPGADSPDTTSNVAGAKLRPQRALTERELPFLQAHAPGPFKVTLPSPSVFMASSFKRGLTDRFYPTRADLLRELVAIVRAEVLRLLDAGVTYVQLDAPHYTWYVDEGVRERMRAEDEDPDRMLADAVAGDAATLEGLRRPGATLAMHVCRGNSRSRWFAEGGYDRIAEHLFATVPVDAYLLEYDSPRAGGFEPLRFVPKGTTVVLGVITTKTPRLEDPDELRRRVDEAAKYVAMDDLAISPQCGFASHSTGNLITVDDERRKLELLVDTARRIWT